MANLIEENALIKDGIAFRVDYETAVEILRPLAEQGDAAAQTELGLIYATGRGVPRDDREASRWFRLAAEQGDAAAQRNLGYMYQKGLGVSQDFHEAVKWLRLAAEQGVADAQSSLGLMYVKGLGVLKTITKRRSCFG